MIGILAPRSNDQHAIPGTRLLEAEDATAHSIALADNLNLKRDSKRPDIILQPQPLDSPMDPLNWSWAKKELYFFSLLFSTSVVGVIGPIISPAPPQIIPELGLTTTRFVSLIGYLVLTYGISSYFAVCLCDMMGRRIACLASHILLVAGIVFAAVAKTYGELLAARMIQGFGMGVYGCLGTVFITDVFFLHQQGLRVAIWQFSFNASICITPIIAGVVVQNLGWRKLFWLVLPFEVVGFLIFLFGQPESLYARDTLRPSSSANQIKPSAPTVNHSAISEKDDWAKAPHTGTSSVALPVEPFPSALESQSMGVQRPSFWTGLSFKFNSGGQGSKQIWKAVVQRLIRPMLLLVAPGEIYAVLLYTFTFSWFVLLSSLYSAIYSAAPYGLSSSAVGILTGTSPLIGVLLAVLSAGPILDSSARYLAKRNKGLFEPEFRLVLNIPCLICFAIGAFGFGHSLQAGESYMTTAVYLAILNAGAAYGTIGSISYAISLYPARAGESFGMIMLLKAIYAWSATLYIADWYASYGPLKWTSTMGSVTIGVLLAGLPVWALGKRWRAWTVSSRRMRAIFVDEMEK